MGEAHAASQADARIVRLYVPSFVSTGSSTIASVASSSVRTSVVFATFETGDGDGDAVDDARDPASCGSVDTRGGDDVEMDKAGLPVNSLFN